MFGCFCGGAHTGYVSLVFFFFPTGTLLSPRVHLKRGLNPGRSRRRHKEAACNIEAREEEEEMEKREEEEEVKIPKPLEERGQEEVGEGFRGRGTGVKI